MTEIFPLCDIIKNKINYKTCISSINVVLNQKSNVIFTPVPNTKFKNSKEFLNLVPDGILNNNILTGVEKTGIEIAEFYYTNIENMLKNKILDHNILYILQQRVYEDLLDIRDDCVWCKCMSNIISKKIESINNQMMLDIFNFISSFSEVKIVNLKMD